ncbi:uncharacterized protein LOC120669992 [Panicum virgatum]|uniref:Uncharacterized protein n=1 Tax=Panicum virgatum TaxID=38727 RepID=A0A8T0T541_PANVG|nr:uncharacterized protein LOC120669992 [Panicum virgatum]KAG2604325.1 hypothetical protein PVAP13_4NG047000 [Panicum virgatum]
MAEQLEVVGESYGGVGNSNSEDDEGPKVYSAGLTHEAIHSHSWRPSGPSWLWISKASAVEGVGFPARQEEVRRLGHLARRVRRVGPPPPLNKPFVAALKEGAMARRAPPLQRIGKRRPDFEDWMEEDDLLDNPREQDLRHKLQRGNREPPSRDWRSEGRHRDLRAPTPLQSARGSNHRGAPPPNARGSMGGDLRGGQTLEEDHHPTLEAAKVPPNPRSDKPKALGSVVEGF